MEKERKEDADLTNTLTGNAHAKVLNATFAARLVILEGAAKAKARDLIKAKVEKQLAKAITVVRAKASSRATHLRAGAWHLQAGWKKCYVSGGNDEVRTCPKTVGGSRCG